MVVMWMALELRRVTALQEAAPAVCSLLLAVCALDSAAALCLFGVALTCVLETGVRGRLCTVPCSVQAKPSG